jgi:hypothetical protein
VVDLHRLGVDVRFQRLVWIRQRRQFMLWHLLLLSYAGKLTRGIAIPMIANDSNV